MTGRIQVAKAMTSSAVIRHELGHLVEYLLGANSDDQPISNHAPYRPILQAIRVAMTKGRTPTQIRQLFRQRVMEM